MSIKNPLKNLESPEDLKFILWGPCVSDFNGDPCGSSWDSFVKDMLVSLMVSSEEMWWESPESLRFVFWEPWIYCNYKFHGNSPFSLSRMGELMDIRSYDNSRVKKPLCPESNIRLLKSKQGFRTHKWKADSFFRSFPSSLRRQVFFSGLKWIGRTTLRSLLAAFSPLGCIQVPFPKHLFRITYTQTLKQLSSWPSVGSQ